MTASRGTLRSLVVTLGGVIVLMACTRNPPDVTTPRTLSPAPRSYEFSSIVVRDSDLPTIRGKEVRFQSRWLGTGPTEMVDCIFTIRDRSGTSVTKRSTYYSAEPTLGGADVILSDPAINSKPSASLEATIECQPLASP